MDLSIIIPTYNPKQRIFARVLEAIRDLNLSGLESECVIVDNGSNPPLADLPYVNEFVRGGHNVRLVREDRQGLTFARLAGIRATSGDAVVVFDDDNVPAPGYLQVAVSCLRERHDVAVWGAGTIEVELLDPVPSWLRQRIIDTHNQRRERFVQYGCVPASWQPYYPIGMGQVIRRDVADRYQRAVEADELQATDRKEGSLASGGDIQIVWQAINLGLAAGVHPELAMVHLIPENRTTVQYLKRLAFGCGMSYYPAFTQSFPAAHAVNRVEPTAWQDAVSLLRFVGHRLVRGRVQFLSLDFANELGLVCGRTTAGRHGSNHWTFQLAKRLGLT